MAESLKLADLLKSTLLKLETRERLQAEDPAVREIRASLMRSLAELQIVKNGSATVIVDSDKAA